MTIQSELLLKSKEINKLVESLAEQIITTYHDQLENIVLVGIVSAGHPLATRLAHVISNKANIDLKVGKLDVSLYRSRLGGRIACNPNAITHKTERTERAVKTAFIIL